MLQMEEARVCVCVCVASFKRQHKSSAAAVFLVIVYHAHRHTRCVLAYTYIDKQQMRAHITHTPCVPRQAVI